MPKNSKHISDDKQFRKDLDEVLQRMKKATGQGAPKGFDPAAAIEYYRASRHRSLAITHVEDAIMRLGMDLKEINEEEPGSAPDPYPESRNPDSQVIEPTADGVKL